MKYYEDPILGKGRAADISGGTGGGGTEYIGGFAIGISGDTISRLRYMPIESVTGNSVTLQAGHAYKAYATSTAITLNTETVPEGQFGMEGHIEIYVSGTGYVVTGTNVVFANALEPDSVNNCTLRFHDGVCIISVEDHVAGYIVVNGSTSGEGSLYYGIATSTNDYVAFDASLNGTTIPLAGAVAEGEKHIVGNGYTSTTLTGAVDCGTSKFTVANLALQDVVVNGGVMTLGDAYIPSGSTIGVANDGRYVAERVTGGGVIDNGGTTRFVVDSATSAYISGTTIANGYWTTYGGNIRMFANSELTMIDCRVTNGNANGTQGDGIGMTNGAVLSATRCTFDIAPRNQDIYMDNVGSMYASDCKIASLRMYEAVGSATFAGSNAVAGNVYGSGKLTLTSGAILDLTGNTNATPIAPGAGVIVDGGCQVITSAGTTVSIAGGTYTKINNDGTTE